MHTSFHESHFLSMIESENILRENCPDLKRRSSRIEKAIHQVLVLRPSFVSEEVGANKKGVIKKMIFPEEIIEYVRL